MTIVAIHTPANWCIDIRSTPHQPPYRYIWIALKHAAPGEGVELSLEMLAAINAVAVTSKPKACCEEWAASKAGERFEPIKQHSDGSWLVADSDGTYSLVGMKFCPFCGDKLPGRT